jgi:hypothetical protein
MRNSTVATAGVLFALVATSCGKPVLEVSSINSTDAAAQVKDNSFSVALALDIVAAHETALVELSGPQKYSQSFSLSKQQIMLNNLVAGDYTLTLQLLTGDTIKQEATAQIHVEIGKVAHANIVLKPADSNTGRIAIRVQEKAEGSIGILPILTPDLAEITISSKRALPICNGFSFNYLTLQGSLSLEECGSNATGMLPATKTFQLNATQKQTVEKVLARLGYLKTSEGIKCEAPLVGRVQIQVSTKDKAGKETLFEVGAPSCLEKDRLVIEQSRLFDAISEIQAFAALLKGSDKEVRR